MKTIFELYPSWDKIIKTVSEVVIIVSMQELITLWCFANSLALSGVANKTIIVNATILIIKNTGANGSSTWKSRTAQKRKSIEQMSTNQRCELTRLFSISVNALLSN